MILQLMKNPLVRMAGGVLIGALLGYLYYRFVGCSTGSCPITKNPWTSTLFGAVMGGLISSGSSQQ